MKRISIFVLIFVLMLGSSCQAQSSSKGENQPNPAESSFDKEAEVAVEIAKLVSTYHKYGQFNGAVLVAKNNELVYKGAFGMANSEWDIPNQTDSKFRLASVSKQFTAMLIIQLVAENKLDLNEPITSYLPDYPKETGGKITIHHLLSHTSGIPNYTSFRNYREMMRDPIQPAGLVELFADSILNFEPGERFDYSNSGYALLGVIIEKITGKTYQKVVKEKIFDPLNMQNSGFDSHRDKLDNRASGYDNFGGKLVNSSYIDMSVAYSAGGLYSTVEDMYLWDQALYTEKLAPKKYMDLLFQPNAASWGNGHYGYGWDIDKMQIGNALEWLETVNHDGVINGFNSMIIRMPKDHSSIILLSNLSSVPLRHMSKGIMGIINDKPYDLPIRSLANSLYVTISQQGIDAGLSLYNLVKDSSTYYLNEDELNLLGYNFMEADQLAEAEAVFKLNVDAFPAASNVYDSYGEVLLARGDTVGGIKNYKKSLELNPRNGNAEMVLNKLGIELPAKIE